MGCPGLSESGRFEFLGWETVLRESDGVIGGDSVAS